MASKLFWLWLWQDVNSWKISYATINHKKDCDNRISTVLAAVPGFALGKIIWKGQKTSYSGETTWTTLGSQVTTHHLLISLVVDHHPLQWTTGCTFSLTTDWTHSLAVNHRLHSLPGGSPSAQPYPWQSTTSTTFSLAVDHKLNPLTFWLVATIRIFSATG